MDQQDRIASTGERPVRPDNPIEQPLSPKDERIVSANPSPDAVIIGPSRDAKRQAESSAAGVHFSIGQQHRAYVSREQNISYGGYGNSSGNWDGYSYNVNALDGLHVSPVIYNDNSSLMFHSGFGFNPEMAYGQYSPVASPLPSVMVEGQLYSTQQIPFSPTYYPQAVPLNAPSAFSLSPSEMMTPESGSDNLIFGPGSGYPMHFGSFGGGNVSVNPASSSLASAAAYPQHMGILGSYEQNVGQRPPHGFGLAPSSSIGCYPHGGSYQSSNFGGASISYLGANDRRLAVDKGRRRERDQDLNFISNDSHDIDRNRGPRASRMKGKSNIEQSSLFGNSKSDSSTSGTLVDSCNYNRQDFVTNYENAKFFIIKSFSEDNVHKSIKYNVWASTPHGNKKLDAAYHEAKEIKDNCPVFLFFSVNASGQFCGVAEMVGSVDFEKDAEYWQQDRWSGQFPVQWHIIKDVPNSRFRHILLENNDNKPVTHSRDSQEVRLEQGIEMLNIFKDHDTETCILDDFTFYNERERTLNGRRERQLASSTTGALFLHANDSVNQISDSFAELLQLDEGSKEKADSGTRGNLKVDASDSVANDTTNQSSKNFFPALQLEHNGKKDLSSANLGDGHQN
ncbi:YTH domain-containing protein [Cephalotus follicularis]|uniref:YTH domain-containing family protein n=1 Tax=Cephalotus follicularis TaxID=3775 RepID=A0A1Q3DFA4_CEPFO|nr:YTH domain-containing protein [Cephalotus follicularis]